MLHNQPEVGLHQRLSDDQHWNSKKHPDVCPVVSQERYKIAAIEQELHDEQRNPSDCDHKEEATPDVPLVLADEPAGLL